MGKILAVCISKKKGEKKVVIPFGNLIVDFGIEGDVHGGNWHRQISLLAKESVDKMRAEGFTLNDGDFAENLVTEGLDLVNNEIGTRFLIGSEVEVELTQIGKKCHTGCSITQQTGKCIMPKEGIFVKVIKPGIVQAGDDIRIKK